MVASPPSSWLRCYVQDRGVTQNCALITSACPPSCPPKIGASRVSRLAASHSRTPWPRIRSIHSPATALQGEGESERRDGITICRGRKAGAHKTQHEGKGWMVEKREKVRKNFRRCERMGVECREEA